MNVQFPVAMMSWPLQSVEFGPFRFLHIRLHEKDGVGNKVNRTEEALCIMLDTARP